MRIAVSADELTGIAASLPEQLRARGHEPLLHGAYLDNETPDAPTAAGARRWNDANVLALSLRVTSEAQLEEILDAWPGAAPSTEDSDTGNIARVAHLDRSS